MKKMRLRTSLSLFMALIVTFTVFLVSALSGTFISRQFDEYVKRTQKEQADILAESIESNYDEKKGGFNLDYVHGMGMYALKDGFILRLYDKDGNALWDAENHDMALCHEVMNNITTKMKEKRPGLEGDFVTYAYDLYVSGIKSGVLEISYYTPYYLNENDFRFINALNMILILVGAVALIIAVILGVMIARRITRPISGVIEATGKIAEGNYDVRVSVNQNEKEIHELAESVNHMAEALKEQEYLRRQMTRDIAHELRTPVTNISSYMEMMIDNVMEPTGDNLKSCYNELARLSGIIKDLDRLQNAELGEIALNKEKIDLTELTETILKGFETGFKDKKIKTEIIGSEVYINADRVRIGQVIANLLSNALKYTDENGNVSVTVSQKGNNAEIVVEDTGIGISSEDRNRVFERFYRTDQSRTRKTGGAGIGLSISKAIVSAHGGSIYCESTIGKGSRFVVTLPMSSVSS